MAVTQVIPRLKTLGIIADCAAWYPWVHQGKSLHRQRLGFDSCAIFYIGGTVEIRLQWDLSAIDLLTAVAEETAVAEGANPAVAAAANQRFDEYRAEAHPGQHWGCYRSVRYNENDGEKNLQDRLEELLTPSTPPATLEQMRWTNRWCRPYLRLKQKTMSREEWQVGNDIHQGAHFPLCVFTGNQGWRSKEGEQKRAHRARIYREKKLKYW